MTKLGQFAVACAAVLCGFGAFGAQAENSTFRAKLTVAGYAGEATLTNFPVLVRISSERIEGFDYARVKSSADLSFGDAEGSLYPYEVETWNPGGESLVWVKVPEVAGDGTEFYVRWAHGTQPVNDPKAVWSDYAGVWHLDGYDATAGAADATGNGFAAVASGTAPYPAETTAVGGALLTPTALRAGDFDAGTADGPRTFTISGWFRAPQYGNGYPIFLKKQGQTDGNHRTGIQFEIENSKTALVFFMQNNNKEYKMPTCLDVTANWQHFVAVADGASGKAWVYLNGVAVASNWSCVVGKNDQPFEIGGNSICMDEIRVNPSAHGADWAKAEYDTIRTDGFVTAGAAESQIGADTLNVMSEPEDVGAPTPAYGQKAGLADGEQVDCTMAATDVAVGEGRRYRLTGWELYSLDGAGRTLVRSNANPLPGEDVKTVKYVHGGAAELVWRWATEYKVTGVCSADEGEVTAESEWVAAGGTFTLTATPRTGFVFAKWEGDLPDGESGLDATISLPADGPRTLTAVFAQSKVISATGAEGGEQLLAALGVAKAGEVITLVEGEYLISVPLSIAVAATVRGAGIDQTVIRQTATNQRVLVLNDAGACVEGCTLTGASFTEEKRCGVGVRIDANGGKLRHCRVTGNTSSRNWNYATAIYETSANALVEDCIIDRNRVTANINATYAGIYAQAGTYDHCLIVENRGQNAGGVYVAGAATFRYCTIAGNVSNSGSDYGSVGGGIRLAAANSVFDHCIIAGNTTVATDTSVGAPEWYGAFYTTFDETVLPTDVGVNSYIHGTPIRCEVLYENAAGGDYRQRLLSAAKDYGYFAPFDYTVPACDFRVTPNDLFAGDPVSFTPCVNGFDAATASYAWTVTRPDGTEDELTGANPNYVPQQVGAYSVKLVVTPETGDPVEYAQANCLVAGFRERTVSTVAELLTAVEQARRGSTITCVANTYELNGQLVLGKGIRLIGPGWDRATLRQTKSGVRVIQMNDPEDYVEGFTITGGGNTNEGEHGCGVRISTFGGTLAKCRVIGNSIRGKNWTFGAGVAMTGDGLVDHCVISNNTFTGGVSQFGGGVYAAKGRVENCLICNNKCHRCGGGLTADGQVTVRNCTIVGNQTSGEGGNVSWTKGSDATFVNCVFARAKSSATDTTAGKPEWVCHLTSNPPNTETTTVAHFDHCVFPEATVTNKQTAGVITLADPVFVDAEAGDYHEQTSSPTKDAGVAYEGLAETDLDGFTRVSGKAVDVGCYEFDSSVFSVGISGPAVKQGLLGTTVAYAALGLDDVGDDVEVTWHVVSPSGQETYPEGRTLDLAVDECGTWTVTVTAVAGGRSSTSLPETYYAIQRELYVKVATDASTAAAAFPFDSWDNAAASVFDAIDAAIDGCTIYLEEGEHAVAKRVNVSKALTLVGKGWKTTTIRQTAKTTSVLYVNNADATVRGVTLTGLRAVGEIHSRGAVIIEAQGGVVEDCRITGNTYDADLQIHQACGIGITLNGDAAVCRRCVIDRNSASKIGGPEANNDRGGGVQGLAGLLENCLVCFNTNRFAAGIYVNSGSKTFTVRNCTVYGNTAVGYDGAKDWGEYGVGGIGVLSGTANVENTIFAANESPYQSWTTGGCPEWRVVPSATGFLPVIKFTNCLMPTDVTWPASATACLNGAPSFMNIEAGNFRLRRGSLGIDAGNTGLVQEALDLARKPRIAPSRPGIVDIGCYENQAEGLVIFLR